MNTQQRSRLDVLLLLAGMLVSIAGAAEQKAMPKQDVVEVPAIGPGLCVANVFQSNMVLQRDKPLNIWGWADPGETVTVSFAGQQVQAKAAADRSWQVTLTPIPANNTPQTMTVKGKSATLKLENILVGDVWVLGGQSNMEFPISNVDDGELEIVSANFPQIRLLTVPQGKGFASVHNRFVPEPVHYRYAWARNPMGNIVNNRGVPLAAQRSDDWILEETPVKIVTPKDMPADAVRRQVANQLRKELERDDLDRRVKEAEATLQELKPLLEKAKADEGKKK